MEVLVTDAFGLSDDVLVSIRYGTTRRQAPLESALSHPLKFPAQLEELSEPLKIDVLQPIASTRLVLHPHEEYYGIGFEQSDNVAMGLHVRASAGGAEAGPSREVPPTKDSAASAKDYLEQNGLLKYVQSLLHAVIQDKPQDPFAYMIEQLTAAKSKSEACARVLSRPTSAVPRSRPSSAMRPASATPAHLRPSPPQVQPLREAPAPEEDPPALPAGQTAAPVPAVSEATDTKQPREADTEHAAPQETQSCEDSEDPTSSAMAQQLREVDRSSDMKLSLLKTLVTASESGDLGAVLSAVNVDKSRSRIQALLEKSAETGELEAALKRTMDTKDASDLEKFKGQLRDVLLDANESGQMLAILEELHRQPQSDNPNKEATEIEKLKEHLKTLLLDANESGRVLEILQEMSAEKMEDATKQAVLQEISEMEVLKQRMKAALFDADSSKILEALETTKRMAPPKPSEAGNQSGTSPAAPVRPAHGAQELVTAQSKMQDGLKNGLLEQGLEKVMQKEKEPAQVSEDAEVKDRLRQTMNEAAERQGLLLTAEAIALEELSDIKGKMKDVMLQAAETGTLAKALEQLLLSVAAKPVGPASSEEEALRANVREKVQESIASGKLEEGFQKLAEKKEKAKEQNELEVLREKIGGILEEASDSGKLDAALQMLQEAQQETIQAAGVDDLDAVRSNLLLVMQDAEDSGKLAAALEAVRKVEDNEAESGKNAADDIAAIKAKFKTLLSEALKSGTLATRVVLLKQPGKVPAPPQGEPPREMELMKAHLREALQHAAECGHLAEALASARCLQEGAGNTDQRSTDVEATAVKLRGVLAEAALCGRLEETLRTLQKGEDLQSSAQPVEEDQKVPEVAAVEAVIPRSADPLSRDEVAEQPPGLEQAASELENLRGRLRNILEVALDEGHLEQAVQKAVERQSPAHDRPDAAGEEQAMGELQVEVDEIRREGRELLETVDRLFTDMQELQQANLRLAQRLDLAGRPLRQVHHPLPGMTEAEALAMMPAEGDLPGLQAQVGRMREESQTLRSTVDRLTREMEDLKRINNDLATKVDDDSWRPASHVEPSQQERSRQEPARQEPTPTRQEPRHQEPPPEEEVMPDP